MLMSVRYCLFLTSSPRGDFSRSKILMNCNSKKSRRKKPSFRLSSRQLSWSFLFRRYCMMDQASFQSRHLKKIVVVVVVVLAFVRSFSFSLEVHFVRKFVHLLFPHLFYHIFHHILPLFLSYFQVDLQLRKNKFKFIMTNYSNKKSL